MLQHDHESILRIATVSGQAVLLVLENRLRKILQRNRKLRFPQDAQCRPAKIVLEDTIPPRDSLALLPSHTRYSVDIYTSHRHCNISMLHG
ncbi:MAG: hypothetical protein U5K37_01830 [Natrialbaceae archaeon]|nr:hypothetical protein [Natrialbaceae archaeon]